VLNVLNGTGNVLDWFFVALAIAAFVVEVWAFVDAIRRPARAFLSAGKQTKQIWLIILGVASVIGLAIAAYGTGLSIIGILPIAAFVAAAIYLADVRPKVREIGGGGSQQGPYGPW
jgi:hypothetical protein